MNNIFYDFTKMYPVSKTLRFELIPQRETLEYLRKNGVLDNDEKKAEDYKKLKKLLDEYYRDYIDRTLHGATLECMDEYERLYSIKNKIKEEKEALETLQDRLRGQIAEILESGEKFKVLFKKEVIEKKLPEFLKEREEDKRIAESFKGFTSMMQGFFDNRKNVFTQEKISTSIAYRTIHENLPKFMNNLRIFNQYVKGKIAVTSELLSKVGVNILDEVFNVDYFSKTLSQSGIETYNSVLGGFSVDEKVKIQGINEHINLFNQKKLGAKIPRLQPLYKQILSDVNTISFIDDKFETDEEVINGVKNLCDEFADNFMQDDCKCSKLMSDINQFNKAGIFIKTNGALTDFSSIIFGKRDTIKDAFNVWYDREKIGTHKYDDKYFAARKTYLKNLDSISLEFIESISEVTLKSRINHTYLELKNSILNAYKEAEKLLNNQYDSKHNLVNDEKAVKLIKTLLDSMKNFEKLVRVFSGTGRENNRDEIFYEELAACMIVLDHLDAAYNKVRNYVTRKPYKTEKIKLTFDTPTLLSGWTKTKEETNKSVILKKEGIYFLGIMDKAYNKIFRNVEILQEGDDTDSYEKMNYMQSKDITLTIPKCTTQVKAVKAHFKNSEADYILNTNRFIKPLLITKEVFDLNNVLYGKHKKFQKDYLRNTGDIKGYSNAIKVWMEFCMRFLESYDTTSEFDFDEVWPLEQYQSIDKFYDAVNKHLYRITFDKISSEIIDSFVKEGKLYLFKIYNKDFSPYSNGRPNLHTLYWKALFDPRNMNNIVYKLNGQAEIFYRKRSIPEDEKTVHPANISIDNKNHDNAKKQSSFGYDIVKDRRYTVDKFQFHVPITMNFAANSRSRINLDMRSAIKHSKELHVIGIDRGERHLLYISVIDMYGNIKEQFSLNEILNEYNGQKYRTDYHNLLDTREIERAESRQEWKTIKSIKELKDGYMSQVVHIISKLMIKYNAIVVLEDLNFGFKRGRLKVEKQVYQKFEKALIDKLNYFVDKTAPADDITGLYNALQLTEKFESFKKIGKQNGALFYVSAWNTSKMDPTTGFVKLIYPKYESVIKSRSFIERIKDVRKVQDECGCYFAFYIDYNDYTEKAEGTKTEWTLCSYGTRIVKKRNSSGYWEDSTISIYEEFCELFKKFSIDINGDIKSQILKIKEVDFYKTFMHLFEYMLQIRNSETNGTIDYMISPVKNSDGKFFNTNEVTDNKLPVNADANGAYNIARKGLWIVEQLKMLSEDKLVDAKLEISNKAWLAFAQRK